jgi:hypothetical protein
MRSPSPFVVCSSFKGEVTLFVVWQDVLKHCVQHRLDVEGNARNGDLDLCHLVPLLFVEGLCSGAPIFEVF